MAQQKETTPAGGTPVALTDRPVSKTQLFVSDLAWSVNEKILRTAFEKHGEIIDCFVAYNGRSSRGFGYVTFKDGASAASAVKEMHGIRLGAPPVPGDGAPTDVGEDGEARGTRVIRVEMARERPADRPRPADGAGGRGGGGAGRGKGEGGKGHRGDADEDRRGRGGRGEGRGGRGEGRGRGKGEGGKGEGDAGRGRGGRGRTEGEHAPPPRADPAPPAPQPVVSAVEETSES